MLRKLLPQGLGTAQGSSLLPILLCCREQWQEELRWDSMWQSSGKPTASGYPLLSLQLGTGPSRVPLCREMEHDDHHHLSHFLPTRSNRSALHRLGAD